MSIWMSFWYRLLRRLSWPDVVTSSPGRLSPALKRRPGEEVDPMSTHAWKLKIIWYVNSYKAPSRPSVWGILYWGGSAIQAIVTTILDKINGTLKPTPLFPIFPPNQRWENDAFPGRYSHINVRGCSSSRCRVCRSWSHLRCLGWKVTIFVLIQVSFRTVCKENYKKCPDTDHTEISFRGQPAPTPLGV